MPRKKFLSKYDEDFNLIEDAGDWVLGQITEREPKTWKQIRKDNNWRRFQELSDAYTKQKYPSADVSSQVSHGKGVVDHLVEPKGRKHNKKSDGG